MSYIGPTRNKIIGSDINVGRKKNNNYCFIIRVNRWSPHDSYWNFPMHALDCIGSQLRMTTYGRADIKESDVIRCALPEKQYTSFNNLYYHYRIGNSPPLQVQRTWEKQIAHHWTILSRRQPKREREKTVINYFLLTSK